MFDEFEKVDEPQEDVVDSQVEDVQESEVDEETQEETVLEDEVEEGVEEETQQEDSEFTEPNNKQSKQTNAQYAKMRRKAEGEAKAKLEKERAELESARKEIEEIKKKQEEERIERETLESVTQQAVSDTAYEMNVSEQYARELLTERAKNEASRKKAEYYENFNKVQKQKAELKDKPFFTELESDIDNMIKQNPSLEPKTAYTFLRGEKFEELMSRQSNIKEKSMVANMHDKARRKSVGSDGSTDSTPELSDFGKKFASFMGVDPKEASEVIKTRKRK